MVSSMAHTISSFHWLLWKSWSSLCIVLLTNKQIDADENTTSLSEVKVHCRRLKNFNWQKWLAFRLPLMWRFVFLWVCCFDGDYLVWWSFHVSRSCFWMWPMWLAKSFTFSCETEAMQFDRQQIGILHSACVTVIVRNNIFVPFLFSYQTQPLLTKL